MRFGADVWGGAGMWASRARGVGIAAFGGALLAGCSWFGIGDAPKPPQMIQPSAQAGDLPQGLGAGGEKRTYADGSGRADVTVVRPLRTEAEPPKVTPQPAPQPAPQQVAKAEPPAVAPVPAAPVPAPQPVAAPAPANPDAALPPRAEMVRAGQAAPGAAASAADLPGAPPAPAPVPGASAKPVKAAPPQPAPEAMQSLDSFVPQSYAVSFLAASVPFGHGSTSLSASDHALLREVVAQYKKTGGALTVVGHASSRTGDMSALEHKLANFDISVRRAEAVARDLMRLGVPARAIYVGAVSDSEPVYREVMPQGEAYNRRTEIFLNY